MTPIIVGSDPPGATWSQIADATTNPSAIVVVTTDLRADLGTDDPRARFEAAGQNLVGPASGGAHAGTGDALVLTRLGSAFQAAMRGLDYRLAIDLGLGWGLDEADLIERLSLQAPLTPVVLVAPKTSTRLAYTIATRSVPVVVVNPHGGDPNDWSQLGAVAVDTVAALRLLLGPAPRGPDVRLVGASRPALEAVATALRRAGVTIAPPSEHARNTIAREVHRRATFDGFVDLTGIATPRHLTLAAEVLRREGPVLVVDPELASDPGALTDATRARRALAAWTQPALAPLPDHDPTRARSLVAAALLTHNYSLSREAALALASSMGLGKPAPSLQVASLGAARDAATRLGHGGAHIHLGAARVMRTVAFDDLATAWDELAAQLPEAQRFEPRWVATTPQAATPFELELAFDPTTDIAPRLRFTAGGTTRDFIVPLTVAAVADIAAVAADAPAGTLVLAAANAALMLPDLARLVLTGTLGTNSVQLVAGSAELAVAPTDAQTEDR